MYTPDKQFMVTPKKIGASDTAVKKHIPADQQRIAGGIQANASGRMAWHMKYLQCGISEIQVLAFGYKAVGAGRRFNGNSEYPGKPAGMLQLVQIILVDQERATEFGFGPCIPGNVIKMAMCINDVNRFKRARRNKIPQFFILVLVVTSRINYNALPGFVVNYERVYSQLIKNKISDCDHNFLKINIPSPG
jgi:hypothetical protein